METQRYQIPFLGGRSICYLREREKAYIKADSAAMRDLLNAGIVAQNQLTEVILPF